MLFSSISFMYYFLPLVVLVHYKLKDNQRNVFLLVASLIFYFMMEPTFIILMLATISMAYFTAMLIDSNNRALNKVSLLFGILIPIVVLIYFKYFNFLVNQTNWLFRLDIPLKNIHLPVGISFYTFQLISYLIDLYRGSIKRDRSFIRFSMYISLFPQLIAGPIVRYTSIKENIIHRSITNQDIFIGIRMFVIGLCYKSILADQLGLFHNKLLDISFSSLMMWTAGISFSLQLYFDFAGYSLMAIGIGKMLGFNFNSNFNYPYISKSIKEFFSRWHISLSQWFRDYVYIPLGGNQKGFKRTILNILIVFALTGLWHGASLNFLLWGIYLGVFLVIEKTLNFKINSKIFIPIKHIYTLIVIVIGFVIFDTTDLSLLQYKLSILFSFSKSTLINSQYVYLLKNNLVLLIISIFISTPIPKNIGIKLLNNINNNRMKTIIYTLTSITLLALATSYLIGNSYQPFLYFRF